MAQLLRYIEDHPGLFIAAGAVISALCTVVGLWFKWRKDQRERDEFFDQLAQLKLEHGGLQERHMILETDYAVLKMEADEGVLELQSAKDRAIEKEKALTAALEAVKDRMSSMEANERRAARLVRKMLELEGRLWEKRVHAGTPRFRPLTERKSAIVSVVNLKGGVGKTTIAAHLGAALAGRGYRPLLIDIDLQGSLSSMFIPLDQMKQRGDDSRMLQHFLSHAAHGSLSLLEFVAPILDDRAGLVATSDKMAYAELNLTLHWLLRLGRRDTRFLLRRALHQKRVTREYDFILLDCPPLINTCCVNALAASDFVLVPVTPSRKSAERVPQLLKVLRDLSSRINPNIEPLGLIMNRTHGHSLTGLETDYWTQVQVHSQDQWGTPVYACRTHIRQTTEVRDAETLFTAPEAGSELHDTFQRLVLEIEERIPRECRRTATASV